MKMEKPMTEAEYRLAELIWEAAPIGSGELVQLCTQRLGWKKSTTYTMLRKLCALGVAKNEDATVTALVPREQVEQYESEAVVEKSFGGSLPAFVAALLRGKKLSQEDVEELRRMIEEAGDE